MHNDDYLPMLADRADAALGAPFKELWADVWDDVRPFVDEAMSGRGTWTEDLPLDMIRGGVVEKTFWTFSYSPLHDDDGRIAGLMNIVTETTGPVRHREALAEEVQRASAALAAQREAERQQRLLQQELSHRLKNTLAMVQAIVSQSLKRADDIESGVRQASERIAALGRAHDTLTSANVGSADIRDVIDTAVKPHRDGPERISVDGPGLGLSAQQALGLSLAVHELSTNAAKYGALSVDQGRIEVAWSADEDGAFDFRWLERGGPRVEVPDRKGFGSTLMTRVVPAYFDGTALIEFAPDGLVYALSGRLAGQGDRQAPPETQATT
jgi:two-component sensor histidine kinase